MCDAHAIFSYSTVGFLVSILFCIICWWATAQLTMVGGASACKLVAPFFGLWDLRRCLSKHQRCTTRTCDGFDAQTAQTAYLFVISTFFLWGCHVGTKNYWRTGWDNNPILPCLNASFGWSCVAWAWHDRKGMKRASRSGWSPEVVCLPTCILVQLKSKDKLSLFGDRMCDSLLAMASHFHISRP